MGSFADKMRTAAKFVVSQLPTVMVADQKLYVRKYEHGTALFNARSRAGELLQLEGSTKVSDGYLTITAINVLLGQLLVNEDGRNFLEDNEDLVWWLELLRSNESLQKEILEKCGFDKWLASQTKTEPTDAPDVPIEEVALGNSEPSSVTE
jgi:hypothetical protein